MSVSVDCVLEQWKALVQREENTAYKSSVSFRCDQTLRDKICKWCYLVIDRWWVEIFVPYEHIKLCTHYCLVNNQDAHVTNAFAYAQISSDIDRSVVSFALSYFDRFMSIHTLKNDISMQLVSMTSLYLAVKIHSTVEISVSSMSRYVH